MTPWLSCPLECKLVGPERAADGPRPDHCHIGHAVAKLKAAHAMAELMRKIEMLFAHLKRNLNFRRLRLRGITFMPYSLPGRLA
jgi:hypothetical protein